MFVNPEIGIERFRGTVYNESIERIGGIYMQIVERIAAFRARMKMEAFDVVIVPTADSHASEYLSDHFKTRRWLCGFTGSAGTLVVAENEAALFTDGRYFIQAERQLAGSGVTLMRMGTAGTPTLTEYLLSMVGEGSRIGVDFSVVSEQFAAGLRRDVKKKNAVLCDTGDWFDDLWKDRPALPEGKAFRLDVQYAGRTAAEKLEGVRAAMREAGAQVHVTNVLDDIAWVLNVRGSDVLHTPVVMSYLIVKEDGAEWFVDGNKVDEKLRASLLEDGVCVRGYDEIIPALEAIEAETSVLVDTGKLTAALTAALAQTHLIGRENPILRMKAVKNDVEIENLRKAHVKDGTAVTRLMYWLKTNVGKIPMTESSVSDYLQQLREEQENYVSLSFDTICAYRSNAAMMHYTATPETAAVLEPRDLLLIDSGGQYLEGTTDITRTFALGEVELEQKKHFTAVLCSVINLASAKFLHGMTGIGLDILARGPIWDMGIDYRCGTGHGVGYLLCVHEGPNSFRWQKSAGRGEDTVLDAGMVTTDEPGVYIEGSHGIRTENELVCRKLEENEYGQFMGFETITCAPIDLDAVIVEQMTQKQRTWLNDYHAFVRQKQMPHMQTQEERTWLEHATRPI